MSKWVNYLILVLLLSVSTQALSVVFDSHAIHQDSEYHVAEVSSPERAVSIDNADSQLNGTNGLDCQHCCHCHGAQHIFLPLLVKALSAEGGYPVPHGLVQPPAAGYLSNLLRPPIA